MHWQKLLITDPFGTDWTIGDILDSSDTSLITSFGFNPEDGTIIWDSVYRALSDSGSDIDAVQSTAARKMQKNLMVDINWIGFAEAISEEAD